MFSDKQKQSIRTTMIKIGRQNENRTQAEYMLKLEFTPIDLQ